MERFILGTFAVVIAASLCPITVLAQDTPPTFTNDQLQKGSEILPNQNYGNEDPMQLVHKYEGLRVSDIIDAMQAAGLQDIGLMDKGIRPLWRDSSDQVAHRIYGVAITYQYLPTNRPQPSGMNYDEFKKWHSHWYRTYAPELFARIVRPGTVVVIDAHDISNTGFIGSNNALSWKNHGMAGVITNGTCRDTDELIVEKIPVYSKYQGGGTKPGRIESAAVNVPVSVGGVMVRPGDMVVADGDGVIVVPREKAEKIAEIAWDVAKGDKKGREKLYKAAGMKEDSTLK